MLQSLFYLYFSIVIQKIMWSIILMEVDPIQEKQ